MADTATLRCPNCGAPAAPGRTRCDYCRATLATVSCPTCFQLLFDGVAFCPHCGSARSRVEAAETASLKCPACRAAMRWVTVGAVDLLECSGCDGTWLEASAFERLCADRDGQAAVVHGARPSQAVTAAPAGPVRYRPCLRCGKLMNRVNFGRMSGTIVDVCRGHGTFLDRGELHQVVDFILNGGLERARQAERDALVQEQRRLRELEGRHGGSPSSLGSGWNELRLLDFLAALTGRNS